MAEARQDKETGAGSHSPAEAPSSPPANVPPSNPQPLTVEESAVRFLIEFTQFSSSPLPSPDLLQKYRDLDLKSYKLALEVAELNARQWLEQQKTQGDHRRRLEADAQTARIRDRQVELDIQKRAQTILAVIAFGILVGGVIGGLIAGWQGIVGFIGSCGVVAAVLRIMQEVFGRKHDKPGS